MSQFGRETPNSDEKRMARAALFGLSKQYQQLNQQISLQKTSIAEQQYTNYLLEQQAAFQNAQEQQRQREKLHDLWCRELEHQGMSPLKASGQAYAELEIQRILHGSSQIFSEFSAAFENAHQSAVAPIVQSKEQQLTWLNIAAVSSLLLAIPTATLWLGAAGVALFCIAYFVHDSKKKINEEELLVAEQVRLTSHAQSLLSPSWEALQQLPKSKLFDDKPARKILKDFMEMDFNEIVE